MVGDNCGRILPKNLGFTVEQENQIAKKDVFFHATKT